MTAPPAALPPGTRIDDYEVRQWLGGGGFGLTYLARDRQLDLLVALKEFFPADCATRTAGGEVVARSDGPPGEQAEAFASGLERFIAEARALANFRHPHIVRVLRHLRTRGTAFIVMEYEQGEPLSRWLPRQRPLREAAVMALANPLLAGLEAVHAAGFLHRDIKPDNIYIRADGSPVLLDFGAARRLTPGGAMTNLISPGFAPLEQYHSQGEQGPWTDLYALGGVLYWMVTGRRPVEAAARVEHDPQVPAVEAALPGAFSEPLLQAIDWALRPQARQRPQSVDAFRAALAGASEGSGSAGAARAGVPAAVGGPRLAAASVVAIGLAGYAVRPAEDQQAARQRLQELLDRILRGLPAERCVAQDHAEGLTLSFLGDPGEALDCTLLLRDLVAQKHRHALPLRIGLHRGAVRAATHPRGRALLEGEALGTALRVMAFAHAREVLSSGPYHDALARACPDRAGLFRFLGQRQDRQGRVHELHALLPTATPRAGPRASDTVPAPPVSAPPAHRALAMTPQPERSLERSIEQPANRSHERPPVSPDMAADLESVLSRFMGPMARLLVRDEARRAPHAQALVDALAGHLASPTHQDAFRRAAWRVLQQAGA